MIWRTKRAMRAKKLALASFLAGRPLELLAAVSVTWSSLIFAMVDYPALIRTMVAASAPGFRPETACAGQTGLEPATCGFGDRCATNCATTLWSECHYLTTHTPV